MNLQAPLKVPSLEELFRNGTLTQTHIDIVVALQNAGGVMTLSQVASIFFPQTEATEVSVYQVIWRKLAPLRTVGLVERYSGRTLFGKRGRKPAGYQHNAIAEYYKNQSLCFLSPNAETKAMIREQLSLFFPRQEVADDLKIERVPVGQNLILHNLMLVEIWARLNKVIKTVLQNADIEWWGTQLSHRSYVVNLEGMRRRVAFSPDSTFAIKRSNVQGEVSEALWFYVEYDTGVMTVGKVIAKLNGYIKWLDHGDWQNDIGIGARFPTVLLITTSGERALRLREGLRETLQERGRLNQIRWLVSDYETLSQNDWQGAVWYTTQLNADTIELIRQRR